MTKIKFKTSEILPSVVQLSQLCNGKNIIKVLDYLRFETNAEVMKITASDNETWMTLTVPLSESDGDNVSFCIDAAKFTSGMRTLGDEIVELKLDQSSHIATFKYGNGHFELPFIDTTEYPMSNEEPSGQEKTTLKISAKDLFNGINITEFATDTDDLRPQMAGIHVDFIKENEMTKIVFVSTDTRKLVRFKEQVEFSDDIVGKGFTLPKKPSSIIASYVSLSGLVESGGMMNVLFSDNKFSISNEYMELSTRLASGKYPNYNAVLPDYPEDKKAIVKRDAFNQALRRVSTFGNQKTQMVILKFENNDVQITASDIDYATSAKETFPCEYNGEPVEIGFPCGALSEVVKNVRDESVCIKLINGTRAAMIVPNNETEGTEYVSIQMPMMI